ncbi:MAG: dual specificity protein phosphatase family protein [Epsilonproteobacteria bacterium]|nr:dual specificity protein phosphatase family protein [Campylobacterota bacterium]
MKKIVKFLVVSVYALIVFAVWWIGYLRYSGNFYKVADGVYRSHQLYSFNLPKYYKKYRFKTILNLRGAKPGKSWYEYEREFCKENNITLIDFKISDKKIQSIQTMQKLVDIVKSAKKPVLIHCKAGADRTGLVSALYLYSIGDKNASKMLSLKYGHFPYLGSPTKAMDESFKKFKSK